MLEIEDLIFEYEGTRLMWDNVRLFVALADKASFTGVAKDMGMSAVTCARRIDQLEAKLGTTLFLRGKSGVRLAAAGEAFLDLVGPVAKDMTAMMALAERLSDAPDRTPVRISGTEPVLAEIIAPHLGQLVSANPELHIHLRTENATVSLSEYEAEIALRFARPEGNSLRVRKLTTYQMGVWSHAQNDTAFGDGPFVGYDDTFGNIPERRWLEDVGVADRATIRTSSIRAMLNVIRSGHAMGILPDRLATRYGDLKRVGTAPAVPGRPLWMLMHPDVARQKSVRTVADWITGLMKSPPPTGAA